MTIVLGLPPQALKPNARPGIYEKAQSKRVYRREARICAQAAMGPSRTPPKWKRAVAILRYHFDKKRKRDADNLLFWAKSAFDGLQDAGIIDDDHGITHLPVQQYVDGENKLVIEIWEWRDQDEAIYKHNSANAERQRARSDSARDTGGADRG